MIKILLEAAEKSVFCLPDVVVASMDQLRKLDEVRLERAMEALELV